MAEKDHTFQKVEGHAHHPLVIYLYLNSVIMLVQICVGVSHIQDVKKMPHR